MPILTYASTILFELFEEIIYLQIQNVKTAKLGKRCCSFCLVLDASCC